MSKLTTILKTAGAAGIALLTLSGAALADGYGGSVKDAPAEEGRKFGYTWTITGASDYMFRGISYTGNDPTVNSYLEFTYGIAYLGLWTSNIDTGDCSGCLGPVEQDVYLGIRPVTGPVNWDIGVLYYAYATKGDVSWTDTDYVEFKIAGTFSPIKNLTLGGTAYWSPEQDLASTENISLEVNAAYTLPQVWIFTPTVSGLFGYSESDKTGFYPTGYWLGDDKYEYWNAGIKLAVEKFTFDFRYWDTNLEAADPANNNLADERFVFTASVTLP